MGRAPRLPLAPLPGGLPAPVSAPSNLRGSLSMLLIWGWILETRVGLLRSQICIKDFLLVRRAVRSGVVMIMCLGLSSQVDGSR